MNDPFIDDQPTMKTITIQDPSEVYAQLKAEFPNCLYNCARYDGSPDGSQWSLIHCNDAHPYVSFEGRGNTVEEAFTDLRSKVAAHDPLKAAREQLVAAGYSISPPASLTTTDPIEAECHV